MKKMRVAIIGQGRSGKSIHGKFFKSPENDLCEVVCIVEKDPARRRKAAAEFGCDVVSDYKKLFNRDDVDLVVNSSFSHQHYPITKDLLSHGKNVLSEKPFARTDFECRDLILTAEKNGVSVFAFHQSLLNPAFLNVKKIIASGKLGKVNQINLKYSRFARRWDWQTLQSFCAGGIYNTGPHPIGQALDLLDWDDNVKVAFSSLHNVFAIGDSDDCAKIILSAPGKPFVDIEVNVNDAFADDYVFKVFGSKGTLISTNSDYKIKYIPDFSVYPERKATTVPISNENGNPAYCSEKLEFTEEGGPITGTSFDTAVKGFYKMVYDTVMRGKKPFIPAEKAEKVIAVIEACHMANPLPMIYD